jgi:predicted metal-dependent hydrolase
MGYFSQKLSLCPKEVKYRKMKRRLGSCSISDVLTFNTLLAKLSYIEIDYVIVHELSHIKHKNHSKKFWHEVSKIFPNYKEIRNNITL